jgi:hypothetical protein
MSDYPQGEISGDEIKNGWELLCNEQKNRKKIMRHTHCVHQQIKNQ